MSEVVNQEGNGQLNCRDEEYMGRRDKLLEIYFSDEMLSISDH